jgi:outer membrane protein insertion porin family
LAALGFALFASPISAQEPASQAARCLTPDTIIVRGNSRVPEDLIVGISGLRAGATLNFPTIQRAIRDLFTTGDYDNVTVTCGVPPDEGRIAIVLTVVERPLLGEISVRGARQVPSSQVEDRVDLLLGRPVDPAAIAVAMRRIDSLYKAQGFYLARVRPETTSIGDRMGLTFQVTEGRRLAIAGLRVAGNSAVPAQDIAKAMETKREGFFWFRDGEFDEDVYAADLGEKIPMLFAERGYVDFQLTRDTLIIDEELGKALIDLTVTEGPLYRVSGFEVVGNRRFSSEQIETLYPFRDRPPTLGERASALVKRRPPATDIFDRSRWDEATQSLRTLYNNDGYIYAQINPVVEKDPTDSNAVVLGLGDLGFAGLATVFAAMTARMRVREMLLPILLLPLLTPVLIAGVKATEAVLEGGLPAAGEALGVLVAFDVIFLVAGGLLFPFVVRD